MVAKLNPIIISMYKLGAGINFVFESMSAWTTSSPEPVRQSGTSPEDQSGTSPELFVDLSSAGKAF